MTRLLLGMLFLILNLSGWCASAVELSGLAVQDARESNLDGVPALALRFSKPLDPARGYDDYLTVSLETTRAAVPGGWVVGDDPQRLLFPHILPETGYRIEVKPGLPAADGSAVATASAHVITTRPLPAAFDFGSRGAVLPAKLTVGLPIVTINVPQVDIQFLRVKDDKLPAFVDGFYLNQQLDNPGCNFWCDSLDEVNTYTESVFLGRFDTNSQPNVRTVTNIPVEELAPLSRPGVYVAVMTQPNRFRNYKVGFFTVSNLGLHLRLYQSGITVLANSLRGGNPLDGVEVELHDIAKGKLLTRGTTDGTGQLRLEMAPSNQQVLIARRDGHLAMIGLREPALDLSEFPVEGDPFRPLELMAYTPRDLYRPGETVQLSLLLRDGDGRAIPAPPLAARLIQPDGRVVRDFVIQPTSAELGYYHTPVSLPAGAPTGNWSLDFRAGSSQARSLQTLKLHVEEFLPERMQLALTPELEQLGPGQPFTVKTRGDYLYGAPAVGNRVQGVVQWEANPHPVSGLEKFFFGNPDALPRPNRQDVTDVDLDPHGEHTYRLQPFATPPVTPLTVNLTASLLEAGGRTVTRQVARPYWPAPELVGVRPLWEGGSAPEESLVGFEVVRGNAKGELLAASGLKVKAIHDYREYYWSFDEDSGWKSEFTLAPYPVWEGVLELAPGAKGKVEFPVKEGNYRLEVVDPATNLTTRFRFSAGWSWEGGGDGGSAALPDRVKLELDRPHYANGAQAQLTVTPPHAGEGIILVEGDRLLWSTRKFIPAEGTTVTLPIAPDWARHDIYVSALVLRPGNVADLTTPNRAVGIVPLRLERESRRLEVQLEVPEVARSETTVPVAIQVAGAANIPALVTIAAVDVGILNITDFATPDPFDFFFRQHGYGVELRDIYGRVIAGRQGERGRLNYGGDAPSFGGARAPAKVKLTEWFSGPVVLDAEGRATVNLPLPDFNGKLRVMAAAFTAGSFGSGARELTVRAPVVAELSAPRFLTPGDRSQAVLELHNMSGAPATLALGLNATAPLALAAPVPSELVLADGERKGLTIPLEAASAFGVGKLQLSLRGGEIGINREWELPVRPAYPGVIVEQRHSLTAKAPFTVRSGIAEQLIPATVDARVWVSATPPFDANGALGQLLNYPFGCLEQTVSGALPLLYLDPPTVERLGIVKFSQERRLRKLEAAFVRLAGMQLLYGPFGMWNAEGDAEPWLTAYAAEFLLEAQEHGFTPPAAMVKLANDYLFEVLQNQRSISELDGDAGVAETLAVRAYAGYLLARVQRAPLGTLRELAKELVTTARSGLPLMQLGVALALQGDPGAGAELLSAGALKQRDKEWWVSDYGSAVRDYGMMIALLGRHHLAPTLMGELAIRLDRELHGRAWLSTQEQVAVFMAAAVLNQPGTKWEATFQQGDRREPLAADRAWQRDLDAAGLAEGVKVETIAGLQLFTGVRVSGYPLKPPAARTDQIAVARAWYGADGKPVGNRPLRSGELIVVHLQVESRLAVPNALVVDLLPAGLELENLNLDQVDQLGRLVKAGVIPGEVLEADRSGIVHQEFRDDRYAAALELGPNSKVSLVYLARAVTPGSYQVAPLLVEDMYRPEIRGVGKESEPLVVNGR